MVPQGEDGADLHVRERARVRLRRAVEQRQPGAVRHLRRRRFHRPMGRKQGRRGARSAEKDGDARPKLPPVERRRAEDRYRRF